MTDLDSRAGYRAAIDALVEECRNGQGSVFPGWARRGVWPSDPEITSFLEPLSVADRELVVRMLSTAYSGAMHDALRVLEDHDFPHLDQAYEGSAYQDFIGRLVTDYAWPID